MNYYEIYGKMLNQTAPQVLSLLRSLGYQWWSDLIRPGLSHKNKKKKKSSI